ncbi:MAG: AraC family transcriptional regulator [Prevotella sp.]
MKIKTILLTITITFAMSNSHKVAGQNDTIRIQHFGEESGFSTTIVQHVIQDRQGYIWLATWDGLRRYDGYRFQTFKAMPGDRSPLETNRFSFIEEDENGNIVCISNDKTYLFNVKTLRFEPYTGKALKRYTPTAPQQEMTMLKSICEDRNSEVTYLFTDRQEGMWAYSNGGLQRVSHVRKPIGTQRTNGECEEVISALMTDSGGRLWVADKQGYVSVRSENGNISWLDSNGNLSGNRRRFGKAAYYIYEDSKANIWIGCKPGGLFRLTPEGTKYSLTHFAPEAGNAYSLNCDNIYSIVEDSRHRLLLATYGGGLNIGVPQADGSMRFINANNRLKQYPKAGMRSRCVRISSDGIVLLGSNDGLYTFVIDDNYENTRFHVNRRSPDNLSSISSNFVMEILQMKQGGIFLATAGGGTDEIISPKLLTDNIRFKHHSVNEGISSDMIQTLVEDLKGNLWIVSAGTISLLNTKTGLATNYWNLLTDKCNFFTETTPALLADGSVVIGTTKGMMTLSPKQMEKSSYCPPIVFDCDNEVKLGTDERNFSIQFAALDFEKNEEIVYAYRMDGIDTTWRYTRQNELNYVGLAPGTYKLHVKSTNGDGVWADNEHTVTLHRAASFHETPWAWMLYGGLLVIVVAAVGSTIMYIRNLKRELRDVKLTSKEQIAVMGAQLKELLPITESVKEIKQETVIGLSADDQAFGERLKAYVEQNIDNPDLTVMDIANEMNVSRTLLFVRMKKIFDSSPNNYLLNLRINHAKKLLGTKGVRVSDVAYQCGFSDPKYFSRCFKKLTGCLPKDYLAENE